MHIFYRLIENKIKNDYFKTTKFVTVTHQKWVSEASVFQ